MVKFRERAKRSWETWGHVAHAKALLESLGLWEWTRNSFIALIMAGASWVLGSFARVPLPWLWGGSVAVFVVVTLVLAMFFAQRAISKLPRPSTANAALAVDFAIEQKEQANSRILGAEANVDSSGKRALPANAKFQYRGQAYYYAPKRYTPQEATDMRALIRDIANVVGRGSALVYHYDGPLVMFCREWLVVIEKNGAHAAIEQLIAFRREITEIGVEIERIINRKPFYKKDLSEIVRDGGAAGEMRSALDEYVVALRPLPPAAGKQLIAAVAGMQNARLNNAIITYSSWSGSFVTLVEQLRIELERLSDSGSDLNIT
jgi:hypothetical protein